MCVCVCFSTQQQQLSNLEMADNAAVVPPPPRCTTCNILFESKDLMRKHYDTDIHLSNVRRRVEGQKPLTQSEYRHSHPNEEEDADGTPLYSCSLCKKSFRSIQTLQSHVKSTAHLMRKEQRIISRDSEAASMLSSTSLGSAAIGLHRRHKMHNKVRIAHKDPAAPHSAAEKVKVSMEDKEEDVDEVRCFFCGFKSETMEQNLEHLEREHEFFVPLKHRCTDMKGLLLYLARKVNGLMCLVCGPDTKCMVSLAALRDHMHACDHERIVLTTEYNDFFGNSLDDFDPVATMPVNEGQLVINGSRTVFKRDAGAGMHLKHKEIEEVTVERKAITTAAQQANAVLRRERQDIMRPELTRQAKEFQRRERQYQTQMLRVSLRANKLHVKGYDGEGEVN
jgi:pre-60S factor REI1